MKLKAPVPWLAAGAAVVTVLAVIWRTPRVDAQRPSASLAAATAAPLRATPRRTDTSFVGSDRCAGCHSEQFSKWRASQHGRAMQHATSENVSGDFNARTLLYGGLVHRFERDGDEYWVTTDGADAKLQRFRVRYTFGVAPLQQYLVELSDGRVQALPFAWDTRPKEQGGQRWFHLYANEQIRAGDVLHWTAPSQNWNHMCADCHSTNVNKGYDARSGKFATTWSELSVGCEACHGAASGHLEWAQTRADDVSRGFELNLQRDTRRTRIASGTWQPATSEAGRTERATCAPCHSRRESLKQPYRAGAPLLDHFAPELLTEPLYGPDGVMHDEVFTYGSFEQSKMARLGVTCSDCHEPHGAALRAPGNAVCTQCHEPARYDAASHHHHGAGRTAASPRAAPGQRCVDCHMPARTYMTVDVRHDHGFRVPRPDESVKWGTPNACTDCHQNRSAKWAATAVEAWLGRPARGYQTYAEPFARARAGERVDAELRALARDQNQPNIARATALYHLRAWPTVANLSSLRAGLKDGDPLLRRTALSALSSFEPRQVAPLVEPLLGDAVLGVRTEAARLLAGAPASWITPRARASLDRALEEYIATQRQTSDRAEAGNNLGLVFLSLGNAVGAERAYLDAIDREPNYAPTYVNLADLYRSLQRDVEGEAWLRRGLERAPEHAELLHSHGLALIRLGRKPEALEPLRRAAVSDANNQRFRYVYDAARAELTKSSHGD